MRTATDIIDALGGSAEVARETGFPLTTIESWKTARFIPDWRRGPLLTLAGAKGVTLSDSDFPPKEARTARQQAAA